MPEFENLRWPPKHLSFLHFDTDIKACDQCNSRKQRCDRQRPCGRCMERHVRCTFDKLHKRRGPAGRRPRSTEKGSENSALASPHAADVEPHQEHCQPPSTHPSDTNLDFGAMLDVMTPAFSGDADLYIPEPPFSGAAWEISGAADVDRQLGVEDSIFTSGRQGLSCGGSELAQRAQVDVYQVMPPLVQLSRSSETATELLSVPIPNQPLPELPGRNCGVVAPGCWPARVKESYLLPLIEMYLGRLYCIAPIFKRSYLHQRMIAHDHRSNPQFGAMLLALAAFMLIQPILTDERKSIADRKRQAIQLMGEAAQLRSIPDFGQEPCLEAVLTSYFLFGCHFGLGQDNAAWFRLKEAVTLGDMMGLQEPIAYAGLSEEEKQQRLRTYWILSVTERAYALQRHRGIHLRRRPSLDSASSRPTTMARTYDEADSKAVCGLQHLVELFELIDERLLDCWNGRCEAHRGQQCANFKRGDAVRYYQVQRTTLWSSRPEVVYASMNTPTVDQPSSPKPFAEVPQIQEVDICISRQWLDYRMWQLCLKHKLLRPDDEMVELRNEYIIAIAENVLRVCKSSSSSSMEVHGVGLVEKVYDVAIALASNTASNTSTAFNTDSNGVRLDRGLREDPLDEVAIHGLLPPSRLLDIREILNGFLAFFALFRGGRHPYLQPFIKVMDDLPPLLEEEDLVGDITML